MKMDFVKYLRDPIHGLIGVFGHELEIIDLPIYQRLRNISQLSFASYVYPSAKHSRFEHSIGVMQTISDYYRAITISEVTDPDHRDQLVDGMFEQDGNIGYLLKLRMAALLHDIGHPPLSHGFEAVLGVKHETYTMALLENSTIRDVLFSWGWSNNDISELKNILSGAVSGEELFLKSMISSSIDADRMDYLIRDSYHCGVKYGVYDYPRLMRGPAVKTFYKNGEEGEVVDIIFNSKVVEEVENFLLARYRMFIQVYLHKTYIGFLNAFWRIYEWLKNNEDQLGITLYPTPGDPYLEEELVMRDDVWLMSLLRSVYWQLKKPFSHFKFENYQKEVVLSLLESVIYRKRVKLVFEKLIGSGERIENLDELKGAIDIMLRDRDIPRGAVMVDTRSFQIYNIFKPDYHVYIYDKIHDRYFRIDQIETSIISQLARKELYYLRIYTLEEYINRVQPYLREYVTD